MKHKYANGRGTPFSIPILNSKNLSIYNRKSGLVTLLICLFSFHLVCFAQESRESGTTDERSKTHSTNRPVDLFSTGLQIGDKVPDVLIQNLYNYKTDKVRLSNFKGKLLIIDFWATWCAPCVAMIPKMDSLQKQFSDQIQFLSVTYQSDKVVIPFLKRFENQRNNKYNIPYVTDESQLQALFPHRALPHYVWIDGDGVVKAVTEYKDVNAVAIQNALKNEFPKTPKKDLIVNYDDKQPFLVNGNGGEGNNLIYHTIFTGFTEGLPLRYNREDLPEGGLKITLQNSTMVWMMQKAYGEGTYFGPSRTIVEASNMDRLFSKAKGEEYLAWLRAGNGHCYEIWVPKKLKNDIYNIMKTDMERLFPDYEAKVEQRKTMCWALKRTSNSESYKTKGGTVVNDFSPFGAIMRNSSFSNLIIRLEVYYMQRSPYPIIDKTAYKGLVDLDLDCSLSDMESINSALEKFGLEFILEEHEIHMLVIRDKVSTLNIE